MLFHDRVDAVNKRRQFKTKVAEAAAPLEVCSRDDRIGPQNETEGKVEVCSKPINRAAMDADRLPAAMDPLRRSARYAPRPEIGMVPTAGEREASPYAK